MPHGIPSLVVTTRCSQAFVVGQGFRESSELGQQSLSGSNKPRIGQAKGGLCTGYACQGKMNRILEPPNSVCSRFGQKLDLIREEWPVFGRMELVYLP